jgi:hypothetical protein
VRRHPPDLKKLARAFVDLARAQAEAEAQSQDGPNQASSVRVERPQKSSSPLDEEQTSKPDEGGSQ